MLRIPTLCLSGVLTVLLSQPSFADNEADSYNISYAIVQTCKSSTGEDEVAKGALFVHCFCLMDTMIKEFSLQEFLHFQGAARKGTWKSLDAVKRIEPKWMSCVESNYD